STSSWSCACCAFSVTRNAASSSGTASCDRELRRGARGMAVADHRILQYRLDLCAGRRAVPAALGLRVDAAGVAAGGGATHGAGRGGRAARAPIPGAALHRLLLPACDRLAAVELDLRADCPGRVQHRLLLRDPA